LQQRERGERKRFSPRPATTETAATTATAAVLQLLLLTQFNVGGFVSGILVDP
jgi:hypothetical protein